MITKVSIIIPVYNVAPYIEECIRSVMSQTMTEGVECIIVDDCGQDNSMEIVERLVAEYKGKIDFHILHHDHNRGLSAARNTGINAAKGEYVYFLDSDDWIENFAVRSLYELTSKYPGVQIVQGGALRTNGRNDMSLAHKDFPEFTDERKKIKIDYFCKLQLPPPAWNKLVHRMFLIDYQLYFMEGLLEEDILWANDLSKHVERVAILALDCYNYRQREGSIMHSIIKDDLTNILNVFEIIINNIDDEYKVEQADSVLQHLYRMHNSNGNIHARRRIRSLISQLSIHYPIIRKGKLHVLSFLLRYKSTKTNTWSSNLCGRLVRDESIRHMVFCIIRKLFRQQFC